MESVGVSLQGVNGTAVIYSTEEDTHGVSAQSFTGTGPVRVRFYQSSLNSCSMQTSFLDKEGREEGRKQRRRKEGRKEGWKEGRK